MPPATPLGLGFNAGLNSPMSAVAATTPTSSEICVKEKLMPSVDSDLNKKLLDLKDFFDSGILTADEYSSAKKRVLGL